MKLTKIDKSHLSPKLIEIQKQKGTYDSPCFSVCNYEGEEMKCQTCQMKRAEKQKWKLANLEEKIQLLDIILQRQK